MTTFMDEYTGTSGKKKRKERKARDAERAEFKGLREVVERAAAAAAKRMAREAEAPPHLNTDLYAIRAKWDAMPTVGGLGQIARGGATLETPVVEDAKRRAAALAAMDVAADVVADAPWIDRPVYDPLNKPTVIKESPAPIAPWPTKEEVEERERRIADDLGHASGSATVYVGNLAPGVGADALGAVFLALRPGRVVSVRVMRDGTGKSRGFAFVEMSTPADAGAALAAHGALLSEQPIVVRPAHDRRKYENGATAQAEREDARLRAVAAKEKQAAQRAAWEAEQAKRAEERARALALKRQRCIQRQEYVMEHGGFVAQQRARCVVAAWDDGLIERGEYPMQLARLESKTAAISLARIMRENKFFRLGNALDRLAGVLS